MRDTLRFSTLKEDRGWYFVEYYPPDAGVPFAVLQLVVPGEVSQFRVAEAMESEAALWLVRYDVPLMVSSFDAVGDLISLSTSRPCDHMFGWREQASTSVVHHWRLVRAEELPKASWEPDTLRSIYRDVPVRTPVDVSTVSRAWRRRARFGWWLVFAWAIALPAGVALVEFNGPVWLAWATLGYALLGAYVQALKLLGWWPKTQADRDSEAEDARKRHHHYHCELNPEGFERLKRENFAREARERTTREAAELKAQAARRPANRPLAEVKRRG